RKLVRLNNPVHSRRFGLLRRSNAWATQGETMTTDLLPTLPQGSYSATVMHSAQNYIAQLELVGGADAFAASVLRDLYITCLERANDAAIWSRVQNVLPA